MAAARRLLVELVAGHVDNGDVALLGLSQNVLDHGIALGVVGHKDLLERHVRAHSLDNRTLAFYVISHMEQLLPFEQKVYHTAAEAQFKRQYQNTAYGEV